MPAQALRRHDGLFRVSPGDFTHDTVLVCRQRLAKGFIATGPVPDTAFPLLATCRFGRAFTGSQDRFAGYGVKLIFVLLCIGNTDLPGKDK